MSNGVAEIHYSSEYTNYCVAANKRTTNGVPTSVKATHLYPVHLKRNILRRCLRRPQLPPLT